MMRTRIFFVSIVILAAILRFLFLGAYPSGFYTDEASFGYNAFSILKTGKDEYGVTFPLVLKSFGDYKAAVFSYYLIPFVWLGGLNEFSVRAGAATASTYLVMLTYGIAKELTGRKRIALLTAWTTAVMPFALQFGRMVHENNLSTVFISLGVYLYILSKKRQIFFPVSMIFFGLSVYTYHDAKVIVPLLVLALLYTHKFFLFFSKKILIISFILCFFLALPFIQLLRIPEVWTRPTYTSLFSDTGTIYEIEQFRREDGLRLTHNKLTENIFRFVRNIISHTSSEFLFITGDSNKIFQTYDNGLLLYVFFPLLMVGIVRSTKIPYQTKMLLYVWIVLSVVPSSLTKLAPSASRIFTVLPPLAIILAYGFDSMRSFNRRHVLLLVLCILCIGNMTFYLHMYYTHTFVRYPKEWHFGQRAMMEYVREHERNYSTIWFSRQASRYIFALFYLQSDPGLYQKQANLSALDEYGFGWISGYDKYIFDDFPVDLSKHPDTLFIGVDFNFISPAEHSIHTIYFPDGKPAYYFVESDAYKS